MITIFVNFRILPSTPKAELKPYSAVFIMATQRLISGFPIKIIPVIVIVSVHIWAQKLNAYFKTVCVVKFNNSISDTFIQNVSDPKISFQSMLCTFSKHVT